jgi:hypothetical protein
VGLPNRARGASSPTLPQPYCNPSRLQALVATNPSGEYPAIEALQGELDAAGGPEDARAKATLRYLVGIATAPRVELIDFPTMPAARLRRCQRLHASTSEAFEKGLPAMVGLLGWILPFSLLRRAAVGSALRCSADPGPWRVSSAGEAQCRAQRRPIGRHPAPQGANDTVRATRAGHEGFGRVSLLLHEVP